MLTGISAVAQSAAQSLAGNAQPNLGQSSELALLTLRVKQSMAEQQAVWQMIHQARALVENVELDSSLDDKPPQKSAKIRL